MKLNLTKKSVERTTVQMYACSCYCNCAPQCSCSCTGPDVKNPNFAGTSESLYQNIYGSNYYSTLTKQIGK